MAPMPLPSDYQELDPLPGSPRAVEAGWMFRASSDGSHVVLPDGRMDLIVSFREGTDGKLRDMTLLIVGPAHRWTEVPVRNGDTFAGIRFRAGWGGRCLMVDPTALRDDALFGTDAEAALGADVSALLGATSRAGLVQALRQVAYDRALAARHAYAPLARALEIIQLGGGRLGLQEVATLVGAPERTLRRHVAAEVGLPFKVFSSVLRFQRTMRLLAAAGPRVYLPTVALEGGYSDQAHMTREFRRHGGFTPGTRPAVVLVGSPLD